MATRATRNLKDALIETRTVDAGATATLYTMAAEGAADYGLTKAAAGAVGIGIVIALGKLEGAAGDRVQIARLAGATKLPCVVGTGGATRGKPLKIVANGLTDATPIAGDGTLVGSVGFACESGVAGDVIAFVPAPQYLTEA